MFLADFLPHGMYPAVDHEMFLAKVLPHGMCPAVVVAGGMFPAVVLHELNQEELLWFYSLQ